MRLQKSCEKTEGVEGRGHIRSEEKEFQIQVKPGWKDGTKLTFEAEGDHGPLALPGDAVFMVRELPHDRFTRQGKDLHAVLELSLKEALCGGERRVTTIDDKVFKLKLEGVIAPNSRKSFKGEGMPVSKNPKERGDLIITFSVKFPDHLSAAQVSSLSKTL